MDMHLRPMTEADRFEVAELIHASLNVWYERHGRQRIFADGPRSTEVFYDVYNALSPGGNVVAVNPRSQRLMGSCFYHPRQHHVSLGVMNVHPNYFGHGVGRALLQHIIDYTDQHGYQSLRLTSSAMNVDSFSLYNKAGFVPRYSYQDMFVAVPVGGLKHSVKGSERVRDAVPADVPKMAALEMEISNICREQDYAYCIKNEAGFWHASVIESSQGGLDGWIISCGHSGMNMVGPCVARGEAEAAALIFRELDQHRGRAPIFIVPMEKHDLVRQIYSWGGKNCELHLCSVRGDFKPFAGINMPSFLPETG